jgi:hypothetical protein
MDRDRDSTPEWWEFDPSERPVPLTGPPAEAGLSQNETFAIADEAESIVRSARDELAGESTDTLVWPLDDSPLTGSRRRRLRAGVGLIPRPGFAVALVAGCLGMFGLGWADGSAARGVSGRDRINKDVNEATIGPSGARSTNRAKSRPRGEGHKSVKKEEQK